jgi:hypothetical protein
MVTSKLDDLFHQYVPRFATNPKLFGKLTAQSEESMETFKNLPPQGLSLLLG